ncbi:MAG: D-glycero-alpha-D-manno-heptose-1,7-bisphosphate 7-phosphatase [Candidatus Eiseniibacteriota bacterium]
MTRPAVLIDRDGTLNQDPGERGWITAPEDFHPVPGALEAVARLNAAGWPVCVVTNQSCIGRRLASAEDVARVHRECERRARAVGAAFDGFHVCPHAPEDGCTCRKPLPGLLLEAAREHGYDLLSSYVVGDSERDMVAGRAAGATPLLVLTGKGTREAESAHHPSHLVFRSLTEAVDWILARPRE